MRTFPHFSVSDQEKRFLYSVDANHSAPPQNFENTDKPKENTDSPQKNPETKEEVKSGAKEEVGKTETRVSNERAKLGKVDKQASDPRVKERSGGIRGQIRARIALPVNPNEAAFQKAREKQANQANDGVPRFKAGTRDLNRSSSDKKAEPYGPGYDPSLMESNDGRSLNSEKRKPAEKARPKGGDGSRSASPEEPATAEVPRGKSNRKMRDAESKKKNEEAYKRDMDIANLDAEGVEKPRDSYQVEKAKEMVPQLEKKFTDVLAKLDQARAEMDGPGDLTSGNVEKFRTLVQSEINSLVKQSKARSIAPNVDVRNDSVLILLERQKIQLQNNYLSPISHLDFPETKKKKGSEKAEKKSTKTETNSDKKSDAKGDAKTEAKPEGKDAPGEGYIKTRDKLMYNREREKYRAATTEWATLPGVGKTDSKGNIFIYRKADIPNSPGEQELQAYSPVTGLQRMDFKTGNWRITGEKSDAYENAHKAALEARDPAWDKHHTSNRDMERTLKYDPVKYPFDAKAEHWDEGLGNKLDEDLGSEPGKRRTSNIDIRNKLKNAIEGELPKDKGPAGAGATEKTSAKPDVKKSEAAKEKTVVDDAPAEAEIPTPKVDKLAEAKPEEKKSDAAKIEEPKPGEKPAEKKAEGKPADGEKKDAKPEAGDKKDEKKTEAEVKKEVEKKAGEKVEAAKDKADSGRFDYDSAIADAKKEINEAKTPEEKLVAGLTLIVLTIGKMIDKNFGEKKDGKEGGGKEGKESKGGTESKEGEKLKSDRQSRLKEELKDHVKKGDKNDVDSLIKEKQDKVDAKVDKGVERKKELDKKINGSDKEISTLETQKNTVKTSLNTAQDQLTALSQKDAAGNKEQIATLKDQIKSFQSDLSDLDTKIDAVKTIKSRAEKEKTDINTEIDEDKDGKDLKEDIKTLKEMKDAADKNAKEMQESFDAGIKPLIDANPLLRGKSVISTYNFKTLEPVVIFDKAIVAEIKKLAGDGADVGSAFEEGGTVKDFDKVKKLFETIKDKVKKPEEKKS